MQTSVKESAALLTAAMRMIAVVSTRMVSTRSESRIEEAEVAHAGACPLEEVDEHGDGAGLEDGGHGLDEQEQHTEDVDLPAP